MRDQGVNIVMVGDLDQSIYGFRDVNIDDINNFVSTHKALLLTNNFRSTQNICKLSSSLKVNKSKDVSMAVHKNDNIPVVIIPYKAKPSKNISDIYFKIISDKAFLKTDTKVISYKEKTALQSLGVKKNDPGNSLLEILGCSINIFRDKTISQKEKLHALLNVEKLLLRLLDQDIQHLSSEIYCERNNIDYRWLKRCALLVLDSSPLAPTNKTELDAWIIPVKQRLSQLPKPLNSKLSWIAPGKIFKKHEKWSIKDTGIDVSYSSTIHGVKGEEFESVLLVLEENKSAGIFNNWVNGNITRAKKLLCLAIPENYLETMKSIIEKNDVVYDVIT